MDIWNCYLVGFFDGATNSSKCSSGDFIILDLGQYYHFYWNNGIGKNYWAEVIAL